jgi:hypothetical protein
MDDHQWERSSNAKGAPSHISAVSVHMVSVREDAIVLIPANYLTD